MDIMGSISLIPKRIRIILAILFGFMIIAFTHYGANATKADVLFAEMVHTVSDTLVILLLFIAFFVNKQLLKIIGKVSGVLLCLAGAIAFGKAYTTFVYSITTQSYAVERGSVLLFVSIATIVLIAFQMLLIWNEHELLHGHEHAHGHLRTVHQATRTELLADIIQAFAGLFEYLVIVALPSSPLLVRFVDLALTLGVGWWMIKRGATILFKKEEPHIHHKHDNNHH